MMNKRLVWNFELQSNDPIDFKQLAEEERELLRWEARHFWPESSIVPLQGLPDYFLDLSHYQIKKRQDTYFLIPDKALNIKKRRDELLYKPLIQQTENSQAFGKKVNLTNQASENTVMGSPPLTVNQVFILLQNSPQIDVDKTALIVKLPTTPVIKIELARLSIVGRNYFSVCIEGRSEYLVNQISQRIIPHSQTSDYVRFLQEIQ